MRRRTRKVVVARWKWKRGLFAIIDPLTGPPVTDGFMVRTAYLIEAGRYDDGSEYQVVRYELERVTEEAKP